MHATTVSTTCSPVSKRSQQFGVMPSPTRRAGADRIQTLGAKDQSRSPTKATSSNEKVIKFVNPVTSKKLVGTLLEVPGRKKVVVLCHGFASHRDGFHFPAIARALAHKRIASLRFDFSGNGDSEGTFEFGNYAAECKDVRAAVLHLRSMAYEVIGVCGHSKGADSVLLYASVYDDVPTVVNIAGRFDMVKGVEQRFGSELLAQVEVEKESDLTVKRDDGTTIKWVLTKWSLQDRLALDMAAAAKRIQLSEVLTIHGSADKTIPVADARQWSKHIASHQLQIVDGADHCFKQSEHAQTMIESIVRHVLPSS